jgi:hypothetical protein
MRNRERRWTAAALLAMTLAGCATNPAPRSWRPAPKEAQRSIRGGWIALERKQPAKERVEGELIAVDDDALHVLTAEGLRAVPRAEVRKAKLVGYGDESGALGAWVGIGTLSTLSHGGFLVLTAPLLWLLGGGSAAADESRAGFIREAEFHAYARFPQGLPPGLDLATLGELSPPGQSSPSPR